MDHMKNDTVPTTIDIKVILNCQRLPRKNFVVQNTQVETIVMKSGMSRRPIDLSVSWIIERNTSVNAQWNSTIMNNTEITNDVFLYGESPLANVSFARPFSSTVNIVAINTSTSKISRNMNVSDAMSSGISILEKEKVYKHMNTNSTGEYGRFQQRRFPKRFRTARNA